MNMHTQQIEQLSKARQQHRESEWRLSFLRAMEAEPIKQPTEEETLTWYRQHQSPAHIWN
jgi:hypothetical protein